MKLAIRIETDIDEGLHENGVDDYSEAILDFCGGQESFSDGFEDEIYNYRQLIIFLGSNIIKEEKEAELKIDESWKNEQEDIRYEVSHVKSFRKFTLHALFVSIHSMYEGRLKEYCLILKQFNKANISLFKNDSVVVILGKIKKKIFLKQKSKENNKAFVFYNNIRNLVVHHRGGINSKTNWALINLISSSDCLKLNQYNLGDYDFKVSITKSIFLLEYLNIIEEELKLICRAANSL